MFFVTIEYSFWETKECDNVMYCLWITNLTNNVSIKLKTNITDPTRGNGSFTTHLLMAR